DSAFIKPLAEASAVWLDSGDPSQLMEAYRGTAVEKELKALLARGGVIGGTSAGAAIMGRGIIAGQTTAKIDKGFGFLTHAVVDDLFLNQQRTDRLVGVLAGYPGLFGLGIDEQTAAIVRGRTITVRGKSSVVTILAPGANRPSLVTKLKAGDRADLVALS